LDCSRASCGLCGIPASNLVEPMADPVAAACASSLAARRSVPVGRNLRRSVGRTPWVVLATCALPCLLLNSGGWRSFSSIPRVGRAGASPAPWHRICSPVAPAAGALSAVGGGGGASAAVGADAAAAKETLLKLVEDFKTRQEEGWEMEDKMEEEKKASKKGGSKSSLLAADSFAAQRTVVSDELSALRNETIDAILRLAQYNPTPEPMHGWRGFGGGSPAGCALNGTWKLLFTDAADATFRKGKRGSATTFQEIDAAGGWFVNCVDFDSQDSKLKGFRVFVEGEALSPTEVQLIFRKVRLSRRSRFPWLFGQITIPLPNPKWLRNIGRLFARVNNKEEGVNPSRRGAGFQLLYVDQDLRVHRTFDGLFFVQRRLS